jgi:RNA polymerase sigma-70 factor (ECF subfamily)
MTELPTDPTSASGRENLPLPLRALKPGRPITERALTHWIERLTPGLVRLSFGICRDRQRAEDVVQEAFVRLWKSPPEGGEPAISSWMRSTVHNLSVSLIRRKRRTWTIIDESGSARDVRAGLPEDGVERREDLSRIGDALERLDPDKRAMIMLRVNEGLSYEAIANHLGVPIGTVMSRLNRARLALLDELGDESEGDQARGRSGDTGPGGAKQAPRTTRPSDFDMRRPRDATR